VPLAMRRLPGGARAAGGALAVPDGIAARLGLAQGEGGSARRAALLPLAIWVALVTALAGPRVLEPSQALPVSGRDLVLALDLSGSMEREDFLLDGEEIRRLDAVKHVATEFVLRRGGDRVALLLFGSKAFFATPQSFDVRAVAAAVEEAEIGIVPRATGISEALGLATRRLRDSAAEARVVVLLSDGRNNAGPVKPRDAARLAAANGIRVHTIAMGPRDLSDPDAEHDAVDAATLRAIADLSGGEYFRVRTTDDLAAVAEAIDRLESTSADGPAALLRRELWVWPAALAVLLAAGLAVREARA